MPKKANGVSLEDSMQLLRNAIRSNQLSFIELYLGWVEGGLTRLRVKDDEINKILHEMNDEINEIKHGIEVRHKDVLPAKFLELEKLLVKKLGIKPTK